MGGGLNIASCMCWGTWGYRPDTSDNVGVKDADHLAFCKTQFIRSIAAFFKLGRAAAADSMRCSVVGSMVMVRKDG